MRLPFHATNFDDVVQYYKTRDKQFRPYGYRLGKTFALCGDGKIVQATFTKDATQYLSFYKMADSQSSMREIIDQRLAYYDILTTEDCGVVDYLNYIGKPHVITGSHLNIPEYKLIQEYYGDGKANRSGVYLMNHIDEGITVLKYFNATDDAIAAYCLHPILQGDVECNTNLDMVISRIPNVRAIMLAMEYRKTAMAYLSKHKMPDNGIELSPLNEVNFMLIADKIQNRKDFELYHLGTHPKSDRLDEYFKQWLRALGVSEATYEHVKNIIKD